MAKIVKTQLQHAFVVSVRTIYPGTAGKARALVREAIAKDPRVWRVTVTPVKEG